MTNQKTMINPDEKKDETISSRIRQSLFEAGELMKNYNYSIFTRVLDEVVQEEITEGRAMKIRFIKNMTNMYSLIIRYKRLNEKISEFEEIIKGMEMPEPFEFFGTNGLDDQELKVILLKKKLHQIKVPDKTWYANMVDEE